MIKNNEGIWAKYLETSLTPEEERLTKVKGERHVAYVAAVTKTIQPSAAGDFEAANDNLVNNAREKFAALRDVVFELLA